MLKKLLSVVTGVLLAVSLVFPAYAAAVPELAAPAGIVMNMNTGEILFEKDMNTAYYPASITKVMTALLVMENCKLDDTVTFSKSATTNLESGAVTVNMAAGDHMTVRQCLYALLLKSANEVANALAEHVSGSVSAFADLMNKRARELGCTNTHFVNPNGLNDPNHYTTAHDMALIARAAFANNTIREIDTTATYKLPATKNNPNGYTINRVNKIISPGNDCYYPYAIASKTGYTSRAGSTLVTAAEKDGVRLVAVVLKSTQYLGHYSDTKALLEYGFAVAAPAPYLTNGIQGGPGAQTSSGSGSSTGTAISGSGSSFAAPGTSIGNDVQLVGPGGVQ